MWLKHYTANVTCRYCINIKTRKLTYLSVPLSYNKWKLWLEFLWKVNTLYLIEFLVKFAWPPLIWLPFTIIFGIYYNTVASRLSKYSVWEDTVTEQSCQDSWLALFRILTLRARSVLLSELHCSPYPALRSMSFSFVKLWLWLNVNFKLSSHDLGSCRFRNPHIFG
jgi:hypothetical protein